MIGRLWRSWTALADAEQYEHLLRTAVTPAIERADGCRGVFLFRRDVRQGVEFVLLSLYDSITAAVRACAGTDNEIALLPAAARALLQGSDDISSHYQTVIPADPTKLLA